MKFCDACSLTRFLIAKDGEIIYKCKLCGSEVKCDPSETRIGGATNLTDTMTELNSIFIKNAAFDPVNQKVEKPCPNCGLAYLTQIQVGDAKVGYVCKCGFVQKMTN